MKSIKKLREKARKQKAVKPKKAKRLGAISRKKRMKNAILISFIIWILLVRKNCNYSI